MSDILALTEAKLSEYCLESGGSPSDTTIIAAVSGGIDSMVLAHALSQVITATKTELILVHFNHHIQPNATKMERVCRKFSLKEQIPLQINSLSFPILKNLESNAREKRYNALYEIAENYKHAFIFTAHHLDDQIETLFMKDVDGGDWISKIGIGERYDKIRRPLLSIRKSEIISYAQNYQLTWEEDPSNRDVSLRRNKVRHTLLPTALKSNPQLETDLLNKAFKSEKKLSLCLENFNTQNKIYFSKQNNSHLRANLRLLKLLDTVELKLFIYYSAKYFNIKIRQYSQACWKEFRIFILSASTGRKFNFHHLQCTLNRDELVIEPYLSENELNKSKSILVHNKSWYDSCFTFTKTNTVEKYHSKYKMIIPSELIKKGLFVRNWEKGDKVISATSGKHSLVSDIFINHKLSQYDKYIQPVIIDRNDRILWIPGLLHGALNNSEFKHENTLVTWLQQ